MLPTRKATRNLVGKTLTELEVQKQYEDIAQSKRRLPTNETMKLIKRFFKPGEIEVTAEKVPLICPISKSRIVTPVRGVFCKHVECFDLRTFLEYHTNAVYWECPFTLCRTKLNCDQLRVDEFFSSILQNTRSTIVEAEIRPDGTWTSVRPPIVGAIVIKEEQPDELQEPTAQAPVNAFIAVKEEPLEEHSVGGTNDSVNLNATNTKSPVVRRAVTATFKAARELKRKALRLQWKRRTASRAKRDRQRRSKAARKTQTKVRACKPKAKDLPVASNSHVQRSAKPEMLVSSASRKDHVSAEQSPLPSPSAKDKNSSLTKQLSEPPQPSTDVTEPSQNKDAGENAPKGRFVCGICGSCYASRSLLLDHIFGCADRTSLSATRDLQRTTNATASDDPSSRPSDNPSPVKNHPKVWTECRCGITGAEWIRGLHDGVSCDVMKRLLENYRSLGYKAPEPVKPKKAVKETAMKASKTAPKQTAVKASKKGVKQTATKASGSASSMRLGVGTSRVTTKAPPPP